MGRSLKKSLWVNDTKKTDPFTLARRLRTDWYDGKRDGELRKQLAIDCLKTLGFYDELVVNFKYEER